MEHLDNVLRNSHVLSAWIVTAKCRKKRERLWEGGRSLDLDLLQCDSDAPIVKSQLAMMAQVLGAISGLLSSEIIPCGRVGADVISFLDRCSGTKIGVHFPYDVKGWNFTAEA